MKLGVGAFIAAIFHVMTHAFFKALLFLGSGSVIHALSGEQDMRKMGGLRKYMPTTYITMGSLRSPPVLLTLAGLLFTPVPDAKTTKNRLHIDLRPDDQAEALAILAELRRLSPSGYRRLDGLGLPAALG